MTDVLFETDSEVAVLSIILNNPDLIYDITDLKSFMFSSKNHTQLFNVIESLADQNLAPDCQLIESKLKTENNLESIGGTDYLLYLKNQTFEESNLKAYEKLVIDRYKARSLISLASRIPNAMVRIEDVDGTISSIRGELDSLSISSGGSSTMILKDTLQDSWNDILYRVENPGIRGFTSGLKNIDLGTTGLNPGDLWIISARPGMGKTSLVCNMILNSSMQGISNLFFQMEMDKNSIVDRLLAIDTQIPLTPNIRMGQLTKGELNTLSDSISKFKNLPIYLDTNKNNSLEYVEATVRKYKKLYDIDVVYFDYLQLLAERNANAVHELGRISRRTKILAGELGITFVLVSQINRGVENRDDKRPIMSDLRQSGNLEEDADLVIGLYRDDFYNSESKSKNIMEFIIRKNRNGPIGTVMLNFDPVTNRAWDR